MKSSGRSAKDRSCSGEHEGHVARQRQRRGGGDPGHVEPAADQAVQARAPGDRPGAEGQPSRDAPRDGLDSRRRRVEPVAEDEQAPRVLREPGRQRAGERGRVVRDAPPRLHAGEAAAVDADDHRAGNVPPAQAIDSAPYMEEGNGSISRGARVALVHDFLLDLRGAERVFAGALRPVPDADVFTAVYDEEGTEGRFAHRNVNTSFLQRLRPDRAHVPRAAAALPLRDRGARPARLRPRGLVARARGRTASSSTSTPCTSATATTRSATPGTTREATLRAPRPARRAPRCGVVFQRWRQWDWIAAQRVDRYVANSETTRAAHRALLRPRRRRSSTRRWRPRASRPASVGDDYVVLSELMPHKRIEVAVEAFNRLRLPLVVVGDGPDARRLRRLAGPTVRFEGRVSDARVAELLSRRRARSSSPRPRSSGSPPSRRRPPAGRSSRWPRAACARPSRRA